jgi:hypothetical protein
MDYADGLALHCPGLIDAVVGNVRWIGVSLSRLRGGCQEFPIGILDGALLSPRRCARRGERAA